ncbi:MAG: hypothetical protein AMXMBFR23_03890 [Chloroflexota bacterium]
MPGQDTPLVAVFNMKGGVGKTTIAANVFRVMSEDYGLKTLLVDFDPQANLSELLLTEEEFVEARSAGQTLLRVLEPDPPESIFSIKGEDLADVGKVTDYTVCVFEADPGHIDLVPGHWDLIHSMLRETSAAQRIARLRLADFFDKARDEYDLVVLDCNPSTSFLTRAAVEHASHLLIPVTLNRYAPIGLNLISQYLDDLPTLRRTPDLIVVINAIQGAYRARQQNIASIRASRYGARTLVNVIEESGVLQAKPDRSGFAVDLGLPYTQRAVDNLRPVAEEVAKRLGLE